MTHYILCGENAVDNFNQQNWKELNSDILKNNNGELISFKNSEFQNGLHELLNSLQGWNCFIELSEDDLNLIEENTSIGILRPKFVSKPIYWSTKDFETRAEENFDELKSDNPKEFEHLTSWEQFYDKSMFAEKLEHMIKTHDCNYGITWDTLDDYIGECEI